MPLPTLTDEQRREALAKAAEARKLRAELKGQLKAEKMIKMPIRLVERHGWVEAVQAALAKREELQRIASASRSRVNFRQIDGIGRAVNGIGIHRQQRSGPFSSGDRSGGITEVCFRKPERAL